MYHMKIFVIRHGEADLNKALILQGQTEDADLNEEGLAQAKTSIDIVPKDITIIFSSPLKRTKQTTEIIAQYIGKKIIYRDELREKHYGSLSGKTRDEGMKITGHTTMDLNLGLDLTEYGGESVENIKIRAKRLLEDIKRDYSQEVPLIVTHLGIIRFIHQMLKGHELAEIANASVHEFEI